MRLIIQLNEASREVMKAVLPQQYLPKLHFSEVIPDGAQEHFGLDPWVNWLSFSLGKELKIHQCLAHGEGARFGGQFLWDKKEKTTRFGMVGVMNVSCDVAAEGIGFFIGDPWTPAAPVKPANLRGFRDGWSYLAKNYGSFQAPALCKALLAIIGKMISTSWGWKSAVRFIQALPQCKGVPFSAIVFVFYDWILCELFVYLNRRTPIDVGVILLNGIAHFQHSYWDLNAGNAFIDAQYRSMLAYLLKQADPTKLDLLNGLEQQRSLDVHVWRQKNPTAFFTNLAPQLCATVEQGMTNDTTLYFSSAENRAVFEKVIQEYSVDGTPLFRVEDSGERFVTIRVNITHAANEAWIMRSGERQLLFSDSFYVYRIRTGEHVKRGFWISSEKYDEQGFTIASLGSYLLHD